jgi:hypothetical protein
MEPLIMSNDQLMMDLIDWARNLTDEERQQVNESLLWWAFDSRVSDTVH